ncbi:hypothetical protein NCC49_004078 [Naganishia albida]|nr:hypothetical protein NCC49_004078 [Naganishia albida]
MAGHDETTTPNTTPLASILDPYSLSKPGFEYDLLDWEGFDDSSDNGQPAEAACTTVSSPTRDVIGLGIINVGTTAVIQQDFLTASTNVVAVDSVGPSSITSTVTAPVSSSVISDTSATGLTDDDSQALIDFMTPEWIAFFQSPEFSEWCAHGMPIDGRLFTFSALPKQAASISTVDPACFLTQDFKEVNNGTDSPGAGGAMVNRFPSTKDALWEFWDSKEPGTISEFRIMEYFRIHGHEGALREMLYYLLPRRLFRMLMEHEADGTLDRFFF